jgi:Pyruvate/2-oxoacid:ferredoxin oxidoreductase delta subunit
VDGNQPEWKAQFFDLFQNSLKYLDEGVKTFKSIQDSSNTALLLSNLGKLYRLQAKALAPSEVKEITITEWKCYSKVINFLKCIFCLSFLLICFYPGFTMLQRSFGTSQFISRNCGCCGVGVYKCTVHAGIVASRLRAFKHQGCYHQSEYTNKLLMIFIPC